MSDRDYCYPPDYTVLRNRLNIRAAPTLEAAERQLVAQRLLEPVPAGDFDLAHLKAIHRHLFQDVYAWAGEIRTVEIATMLRRDGAWLRFPMAFRYGPSYGFQFEPQLTLGELRVWNRELAGDYELMGGRFDAAEEAARNLREFTAYATLYERQMARMVRVPEADARMNGGSGEGDPGGLAVPREVRTLLAGFDRPWWVAGGWAIDLFVGRRTRAHKDIEIALFRHDQSAVQKHLAGWSLRKVVDHRLEPWLPGERLTLPVHEIHGRGPGGQALEILLNEHHRGRWVFRRDPAITWPAKLIGGRSADRVPFLRPEIVLLYKSRDAGPDDHADFERAVGLLDHESRIWLVGALQRHRPGHPWLYEL